VFGRWNGRFGAIWPGIQSGFSVSRQIIQRERVVSGGQTGVDRAALDAALQLGWPVGGWCPLHRRAEDGRIPSRYPLTETPVRSYAVRTEWNVRDSDGTLALVLAEISSGTQLTIAAADRLGKPCRIEYLGIDPGCVKSGRLIFPDAETVTLAGQVAQVVHWIQRTGIRVLNIAGPRGSTSPHVYSVAREFVVELLKQWQVAAVLQG
jgi:hypothetical protein